MFSYPEFSPFEVIFQFSPCHPRHAKSLFSIKYPATVLPDNVYSEIEVEAQLTVVRITIKKTLTQGGYAYRQSASGPFATDYLVRTNAPFPSPQLADYATNIALAESRLYPAIVRFDRASVKLATPGASSDELRGQFSQVGLDRLQGQLELGEDEVLAFPSVTAVYSRSALGGRHGRLVLPHALTATEWNLYAHERELPPRYQKPGDSDQTPFSQQLLDAIRAANGSYVMSAGEGDTEQSLRKVVGFFFHGFQVAPLKAKGKKSGVAAKRAAKLRASLQPGETDPDNIAPQASRSTRTKVPAPGVVYLLKAGGHFKIGMSTNPDKRIGQIKLQLPYPVEVMHTIRAANPLAAEAHWHRRFAALRQNGEWFLLTGAEVSEFKSVSEM